MGEKHLIQIVTLLWRVSKKIMQQSEEQALNKRATFSYIFLAIPRKIETGLPVLVVALSMFQQFQMFRCKLDAM